MAVSSIGKVDKYGLLKAIAHQEMLLDALDARTDLRLFCKLAWPHLLPGIPLSWSWHHDALCDHLQALHDRDILRLLINIAPGHTKSTIVSVMFPAWTWITEPNARWLCASNNFSLALRDNMDSRRLIESDWYQTCYRDCYQLAEDQNAKMFYANNAGGYRMAFGVRGKVTGKRGNYLSIDDPHDAMEGQTERRNVLEWFTSAWVSRLNDYHTGLMLVIGQRVHAEDLSGYILKNLSDWTHLNLPAQYEPSRKCFTSIGWSDPRTEEGELLWPEKFPPAIIDNLKVTLGSMVFASQYQQSPVPSDGGVFKKQWLRYYTAHDDYYELQRANGITRIPVTACRRILTVDLAISEKQSADYTVIAVWDISKDNDVVLVDLFRARLDNPSQQRQIQVMAQRHAPQYIIVETVAYQLSLVQQLRNQGLPVKEYKPVRDKVSRATTAAVQMEGEKVFLPTQAAWLADVEQELLLFPKGAHDDCVDNFSMIAEHVARPHGPVMWSADTYDVTPQEPPRREDGTAMQMVEIERVDMFEMHNTFAEVGQFYDMGGY